MDIINFILGIINDFPILTVLLSTFLLGDEMVYFFGFLSGNDLIKIWIVIIFSIIGNGGCDILWITIARFNYLKKIRKWIKKEIKSENTKEFKKNIKKKKIFFFLLLSKFFYGTRLLTIFYFAKKEKIFSRLILLNSLAVIIWVIVVTFFMWIIGKWTAISFESINNVKKIIGFAILFAIIIYLLNRFIISKYLKNSLIKKNYI